MNVGPGNNPREFSRSSLNVELGLRDFDDLMDGLSPAIMQCLRELGRDVALPGSCSAHL